MHSPSSASPPNVADDRVRACSADFAKIGQEPPQLRLTYSGLGRTPEVPSELANEYPHLQRNLESIGVFLKESRDSSRLLKSAKKEALDRLDIYGDKLSDSNKIVFKTVLERLHDPTGWSEYSKELTLAGAKWIHKTGSLAERETLRAKGEISKRAMLAVIAQRIKLRGEVLQKFEGRDAKAFDAAIVRGPIIDNGGAHNSLAHLIQMDYMAPTLEEFYGRGSREFYQAVVDNHLFDPLFDRAEYQFGSPTGITYIIGDVLPLSDYD